MTEPAPMAAVVPPIKFYDSASHTFPPGAQYVAVYADGTYQAPPDIYHQYPHVHSITSTGQSWKPQLGDYEPTLPLYDVPGRCRQWVEHRLNRRLRSIVYVDRDNLFRLHAELGPYLFTHQLVHFWIPTLDGQHWGPVELSVNIQGGWGFWIPPGRLWANQYADAQQSGGDWDTSNLFGAW
jgi:hypothetical protein